MAFPKGKAREKAPKRIKVNPATEESGGLTFTHEFNIYRDATYANIVIDYATRDGWVVGMQLLNVPVAGNGAQTFQNDGYLMLSKTFNINDTWSLAVGSQNGSVLTHAPTRRWHNFTFLDNQVIPDERLNFHLGVFYVNEALATIHQPYGAMAGVEIRMIPKVLHLQADYFSGTSNISGNIVNLFYYPVTNWQTYIGVIIPAPHTGGEFAGNVGFAYNWR
ncbi:MAG: hypothetical protein ACR65R_11250 [Methylomicrobium sp.]